MSRVRVLDCTLRDGGYCNDCHFGLANSRYLVDCLVQAGVDIIECGFLTQKKPYEEDYTRFNTLEQAARLLPQDRAGRLFVALLDYGTYDVEDLPPWDGGSLDGIRVTFHKAAHPGEGLQGVFAAHGGFELHGPGVPGAH